MRSRTPLLRLPALALAAAVLLNGPATNAADPVLPPPVGPLVPRAGWPPVAPGGADAGGGRSLSPELVPALVPQPQGGLRGGQGRGQTLRRGVRAARLS